MTITRVHAFSGDFLTHLTRQLVEQGGPAMPCQVFRHFVTTPDAMQELAAHMLGVAHEAACPEPAGPPSRGMDTPPLDSARPRLKSTGRDDFVPSGTGRDLFRPTGQE